ncbi:ATP-binding cassette domain-containing protein [Nocardia sp. NPDC057353]|uniref:ABC transporter ATP-binding protein/permease n=1 Tax=Nocardia sp. NPDC057353 TaxID=3346104 RepID=UPI0036305EF2
MTRVRTGWALVAAAVLLLVLTGPLLAPHPPTAVVGAPFLDPEAAHPLGTDVIGRDVLSRVLHGGLPLVSMAAAALALSYAAGIGLGVVAGLRRRADPWISHPVDAVVVLPWFLLLAVLATALGAGPAAVATATALAATPWIVRIVRTATVEIAATGYLESARARGEPLWRLALVEVLPNLRPVLAADAGVRLSATMSIVAVSSFLGLGLRPPSADWALMITENRQGFGQQPVAVLAPALLIMVLVVAANMVSDRALDTGVGTAALPPVPDAGDGVRVRGLRVRAGDGTPVLDGIDLELPRGSAVAVVGPSGAGKTTLALAILGALPAGLVAEGQVSVGAAGGRAVGYVPQDPGTGLNPALRIGTAIAEITRLHGDSVRAALRRVGLPDDRGFRRRYPHQLSGGQQQRVLLAMALLGDPAVVVLDEPTTGLDAGARAELVRSLEALRRDTTLLVITHDPAALAPVVQHVVELDRGALVSYRPVAEPVPAPARSRKSVPLGDTEPVLRVDVLTTGHRRAQPVVAELSFALRPGRCLALTGPSGAGKTTLARTLAGLHPLERGSVTLHGKPLHPRVDHRPIAQRRAIQLVFQNPATSLNPAQSVGAQIARPLRLLRGMTAVDAARETSRLLAAVRLDPELAARRPDRLSGGQQQRAALARALAAGPEVLLCDEITASLDHRAAEVVLDILDGLRASGVALVVISHQQWVIERLADDIIDLAENHVSSALNRLAPRRVSGRRCRASSPT